MAVIADISVSLDGFVTGPEPDLEHGLGRGGELLHDWAVRSKHPVDVAALRRATEATGAVIMGRRLFDFVDGPHGWSDEMGYGAARAARPAFFVITHSEPRDVRLDLDITFVTTGIGDAVAQARRSADERDVW